MNLDEYLERIVRVTAKYPGFGEGNLAYPALGLNGEAGEVAEKVKKIMRDKDGVVSGDDVTQIQKELGVVLWHIGAMCLELNISLQSVLDANAEKLLSRLVRGKLSGSGDDR